MSTLAILVGFILMLFLPCAITLLGSREEDDGSSYSDRVIDPIIRARVVQTVETAPERASTRSITVSSTPFESSDSAAEDPIVPGRLQKALHARMLHDEMEALSAIAAAARAQADALAASARLAAAKAEAAETQAVIAEAAAATAIHTIRHAA